MRVVLGRAEDGAARPVSRPGGHSHRQAPGDRIDLLVSALVDDDPFRAPHGIDPRESRHQGSTTRRGAEIQTGNRDTTISEGPARRTAPRTVTGACPWTAVAACNLGTADEEGDCPPAVADSLDDEILASGSPYVGAALQAGPLGPDRSNLDSRHPKVAVASKDLRYSGGLRTVDKPWLRIESAHSRRSKQSQGKPAEGRNSRPSADRRATQTHPHASRRTPLNMLCDRKLSIHLLVP